MKEKKQPSAVSQLNRLCKQGKTVEVTWSGGSDSGCYRLLIDGKDCSDHSLFDLIEDDIHQELGYGGFDGDFSTEGKLVYDSKEKSFIGVGTDSVAESTTLENIKIRFSVPSNLYFDSVIITQEGDFSEHTDDIVKVRFIVKNGPVFKEHLEVEEKLSSKLGADLYNEVTSQPNLDFDDVRYGYNDWQFDREDFVKNNKGDLIAFITSIDVSYYRKDSVSFTVKI